MLDSLPGGEDYILRPVDAGMCSMADLKGGVIDLYDVALMNDYLDMKADNDARIAKWRQDNEC
ncbi:NTP pyrophosphohydrolase [Serratia rubidaea]|nr:NTP pyrophosphohydrolase [Serratia rubidaea]